MSEQQAAAGSSDTWLPPGYARQLRLGVGLGVLYLGLGLLWLTVVGNQWLGVLYVALGVVQAVAAGPLLRHQRVTASAAGLDVPYRLGRVTVPWGDVGAVRGNAGAWSEYTVVQRRGGQPIKLAKGLSPDAVERWQARYT